MNDIELRYSKVQTKLALVEGRSCDKYDYLISVFSGVVCGIIDSIFLNKPNVKNEKNSALNTLTDKEAERVLSLIADKQISSDLKVFDSLKAEGLKGEELRNALEDAGAPRNFSSKGYESVSDKITYLENKYRVSYDQSTSNEFFGDCDGITPMNHHLKSLAHCPDIIGLCASILDQFTGETTFVSKGQLIRVVPVKNSVELRGENVIAKLFCGFSNWMGHLLSDFCGSHSAKGRGMGIPIPFYELFQFCDFGNFNVPKGTGNSTQMSLAELSAKVFENGYDARFGAAMAIPVILNDLIIKFLWSLKQRFYHQAPWKECIPTNKHASLRLMLIIGNATLCFVDGMDAAIRSKGSWIEFLLRINLIAWFKLVIRILKEIMIRYDFTYEDLRIQFEYLNYQMDLYIERLQQVDYAGYERKLAELEVISSMLLLEDVDSVSGKMSEYIVNSEIESDFTDFDEFTELMNDGNHIFKF